MFARIIVVFLVILFSVSTGASSSLSKHPLVLDFLMVGDLQGWPNHLGDDEPAIDITLVPARAFMMGIPDEDLHRLSRIYFPRNQDKMLEYEVLFFNHPRLDFFTPQQQAIMVDFVGTKGRASIAYPLSNYPEVQYPWIISPISQAFPVDLEEYVFGIPPSVIEEWWGNRPLKLTPGLPPVFSVFESTGIFDSRIYRTNRPCPAKEGATIWVRMIDGPSVMPEAPAFISWPYGDSDAWAFGIHPGMDRPHWEIAGEWWELIFLNICTHTISGKTLTLEEAVDKRSVKTQFAYFRDSASMFQSIVDFVSKVGANTIQAEATLSEGNKVKAEAEEDYLERRYEEASEKMEGALLLVDQAMDEAQRAKDSALFWIYVSEWMATTAVALISGVVLWWLMIRRGLYREVTTTQLRHL